MSEYLLPPYKKYIKTNTGKIVRYSLVFKSEIFRGDLYLYWEEINYGQRVVFGERVVATADTMEELTNGKDYVSRKRPY